MGRSVQCQHCGQFGHNRRGCPEIKAAYEGEADTNAFTDADHTKLDGIEAGAQVNTVTSVNGETGAVTVQGFSGDYDDLTVWEQLDGGASWSATKKVFLIVPTLVLLAYLNAADFSRQALTIHVPIYALLCILPKLPGMHRVRILGINRTVGFDESFDDEAKKGS